MLNVDQLSHDQRFKALIREFFSDFMYLFFADWAAKFDFSSTEWLDTELHADAPEGQRHLLDLVAKVRTLEAPTAPPAELIALIHIEIEAPDRTTLLKPRLPAYHLHLHERYGLPVLPIVLYLKVGLDGIGVDTVTHRIFDFESMTFRYLYVGLPGLDAEPYLRGDNWLGVALSALMRIPRERIVEWGVEAMLRIGASGVNQHQKYLLGDCFEAYLDVDESTTREFHRQIEEKASGRVNAMNKTRVELAREDGLERGREEGIRLARQLNILEILEARFPTVDPRLAERIKKESRLDILIRLSQAALKSHSSEDFIAALDREV
jgi:hypothetical protein